MLIRYAFLFFSQSISGGYHDYLQAFAQFRTSMKLYPGTSMKLYPGT